MSAPEEPMVSVFHFTSRISSAKIRKYKIATEKGMGGRTPTPGLGHSNSTPSPALGPTTMDPPPPRKKPRISLTVRKPSPSQSTKQSQSHSPDTIAVSRPKRASTRNAHYSEDAMDVDIDEEEVTDISQPQAAPPQSPAASSDLSSFMSLPPMEKEPTPAAQPAERPSKPTDYGKDFMSYYVTGGDDEQEPNEDEEVVVVKAAKAIRTSEPAALQAPPPPQPLTKPPPKAPEVLSQRQSRPPQAQFQGFQNHSGPPGPYPTSAREPRPPPPPPPPPIPRPDPELDDTFMKLYGPWPRVYVGNMVVIVTQLSQLLATFNGVALPPMSPSPQTAPPPQTQVPGPNKMSTGGKASTASSAKSTSDQGGKAADTLLAAFDDDDDDEEEHGERPEKPKPQRIRQTPITNSAPPANTNTGPAMTFAPNMLLPYEGEFDHSLIHGIEFIMNALRSWASARLTQDWTSHYYDYHTRARQAAEDARRRGPGRPRRTNEFEGVQLPPQKMLLNLRNTHEGHIIQLFLEVLRAGVLRRNVSYPRDLARALSTLYKQIDQLINKGSTTPEPPWQMMSYGAQIAAHRAAVGKVKEAHARAQAEMERDQMYSHQHMQGQMRMVPTRMPPGIDGMDQSSRRGSGRNGDQQHLQQQRYSQPHPSSYQVSNPAHLGNQYGPGPPSIYNNSLPYGQNSLQASSYQSAPGGQASYGAPSPHARNSTAGMSAAYGMTLGSNADPRSSRLPQVPSSPAGAGGVNLLSRSGGAMKFSFQPDNPTAVPSKSSNTLVNGPTSNDTASTSQQANMPAQPVYGTGSPPNNSHAPIPMPLLARVPSDTIQVAMKPVRRATRITPPLPDIPATSGSYNTFAVGRTPTLRSNGPPPNASVPAQSLSSAPPNEAFTARPSSSASNATPPVDKAAAASNINTTSAPGSAKSG